MKKNPVLAYKGVLAIFFSISMVWVFLYSFFFFFGQEKHRISSKVLTLEVLNVLSIIWVFLNLGKQTYVSMQTPGDTLKS